MYKCEDCNAEFESPLVRRHIERSGEELDPPSHHCPYCMSAYYHELEECKVCGELKDSRIVYNGVCDDCDAAIDLKLVNLIKRNFTVAEAETLKERIGIGGIL